MSKLVIKNNINSELAITHVDNKPAKSIVGSDIAVAVDTITDFPLDTSDGDTVIVRDLNRGGTFIYDSSKVAEHNDGTNFNGWIRQYSGAVNVKWFGVDIEKDDNTSFLQYIVDNFDYVYIPKGVFKHKGIKPKSTCHITGSGFNSVLKNTATDGSHSIFYDGGGSDIQSLIRNIEQTLTDVCLEGNSLSGDGIRLQIIGRVDNGTKDSKPSIGLFNHVKIINHGGSAIQFGESASVGAGNKITISNSVLSYNRDGILIQGQSNTASIVFNTISNNTNKGVYLNYVASTNLVMHNQIMDNGNWGVYCFSAEQPLIQFNAFNRNKGGSVAFAGASDKSTEAGIITGNLFGDDGSGATISREISLYYTKNVTISSNYFYCTGQDELIYLSDHNTDVNIFSNHYKDITTEIKLSIKDNVIDTYYTFSDGSLGSTTENVYSNRFLENKQDSNILFRNKTDTDNNPQFRLDFDGAMKWGSGNIPEDVTLSRVNSGALRCSGGFECNTVEVSDGIAEPPTKSGYARLFVDSTDGDLKIKFGDGTVKTIISDT